MSESFTLHLLRHGQVHNPEKVLYGRLPGFGLSETGRAQAQAAGDWLATQPITAVYASPMERAQETARLAVARLPDSIEIATDERLTECLTPHEGRALAELEPTLLEIYTGNQSPYETVADLRRRLLAFIAEMRVRHASQTIAAVTHGDMLVVALLYAAGTDDTTIGRSLLKSLGLPVPYPATASLISLTYVTDQADQIPQWTYTDPHNT